MRTLIAITTLALLALAVPDQAAACTLCGGHFSKDTHFRVAEPYGGPLASPVGSRSWVDTVRCLEVQRKGLTYYAGGTTQNGHPLVIICGACRTNNK